MVIMSISMVQGMEEQARKPRERSLLAEFNKEWETRNLPETPRNCEILFKVPSTPKKRPRDGMHTPLDHKIEYSTPRVKRLEDYRKGSDDLLCNTIPNKPLEEDNTRNHTFVQRSLVPAFNQSAEESLLKEPNEIRVEYPNGFVLNFDEESSLLNEKYNNDVNSSDATTETEEEKNDK